MPIQPKWRGDQCQQSHRLWPTQRSLRRFELRVRGFRLSQDPFTSDPQRVHGDRRSEEHTSELQSLMRISYAVLCLKKKKTIYINLYYHILTKIKTPSEHLASSTIPLLQHYD